jgi:pimeloyl-ACP methyl ester carboxylesterase
MPLFIAFAFLLIIPGTAILISNNNYSGTTNLVYGQPNQMNSNATNSLNIQNIPVKKVHVDDIDIAYKTFGKGDPILLISGVPLVMDAWPSSILRELSSNHTVIILDNRGVGNSTSGTKPFSIQQFTNDTNGLLDALKIHKADVLGFSMGSEIAQQLAVTHPEKVNRLVLYASSCGGKESVPPSPSSSNIGKGILSNPGILKNPTQVTQAFLPLLFPQKWIANNPNFVPKFLTMIRMLKEIDPPTTFARQIEAAVSWTGSCNQLAKISNPTLVITGTDDAISPSANSLIIAGKIPGAWLVQINGAGHGLMFQYPDKFSNILQTFLSTTTSPG